jgi:hypothetical protein
MTLPRLLAVITNPALPGAPGLADPGSGGGGNAVGRLIANIVGAIMILAFLMALFYLLAGGLSWISGGSDKAQLESARNKIIHAIIGLIIVASIWAIMNIVGPFLGLDFPNLRLPTMY